MIRRRYVIRGRVQGVGFRYYVLRCVHGWPVCGHVRNQMDGSVLIEAEGDAAAVDSFMTEVMREPPGRVDSRAVTEIPATGGTGFRIRY